METSEMFATRPWRSLTGQPARPSARPSSTRAKSTSTVAYYYFNYAVNIGANASQTFTIGTFVNGYYTRNATADNGTTIVKKP